MGTPTFGSFGFNATFSQSRKYNGWAAQLQASSGPFPPMQGWGYYDTTANELTFTLLYSEPSGGQTQGNGRIGKSGFHASFTSTSIQGPINGLFLWDLSPSSAQQPAFNLSQE